MADYTFTTISRPVRTKDNEEFFNVFLDLGFEESCEIDGKARILSYGEATWTDDMFVIIDDSTGKALGAYVDGDEQDFLSRLEELTGEEFDTEADALVKYSKEPIATYVQDSLLEGEAFVLQEVGNERLRYNSGWAIVITKDDIKSFDLDLIVNDYLEGVK